MISRPSVRPSVSLSATLVYLDHIGLNLFFEINYMNIEWQRSADQL